MLVFWTAVDGAVVVVVSEVPWFVGIDVCFFWCATVG